MTVSETEIIDQYRCLALEWAELRGDPKKANKVFKQHHAYYKQVRDLPAGQAALLVLLSDPEPSVRLLAATHALRFAEREAVPVLNALERSAGVYAMDAEYTLTNFREGRLDLDW